MVAYSFNPRFAEAIVTGTKRQTIRAVGLRRHAQPGVPIQLYTGMRTAQCRKLLPDVRCTDACPIVIEFDDAMRVVRIEEAGIPVRELAAFARRDGFADLADMGEFWGHHHGVIDRFEGVLIAWAWPKPADAEAVAA